jgi:hypothetical protein
MYLLHKVKKYASHASKNVLIKHRVNVKVPSTKLLMCSLTVAKLDNVAQCRATSMMTSFNSHMCYYGSDLLNSFPPPPQCCLSKTEKIATGGHNTATYIFHTSKLND